MGDVPDDELMVGSRWMPDGHIDGHERIFGKISQVEWENFDKICSIYKRKDKARKKWVCKNPTCRFAIRAKKLDDDSGAWIIGQPSGSDSFAEHTIDHRDPEDKTGKRRNPNTKSLQAISQVVRDYTPIDDSAKGKRMKLSETLIAQVEDEKMIRIGKDQAKSIVRGMPRKRSRKKVPNIMMDSGPPQATTIATPTPLNMLAVGAREAHQIVHATTIHQRIEENAAITAVIVPSRHDDEVTHVAAQHPHTSVQTHKY